MTPKNSSKTVVYASVMVLPVWLIFPVASVFGLISGDFGFIGGDDALRRTFLIGMTFAPPFAYFFDGAVEKLLN